jgi:hypothetical protein
MNALTSAFKKNCLAMKCLLFQEAGWAGKKNGELLSLASNEYDVFLTVDRNLYFQQNIPKLKIAVLALIARSNRLADLEPLAAEALSRLMMLKPGEIAFVPKQPS